MNNIYKKYLIGNTPLVRLFEIEKAYNLKAHLYAKLEWYNLTGSIKDRTALQILLDAKENGLKDGALVIEATSGNTGIALAALCSKMGYKCAIVMPENMSDERKAMIKSYGADLVLTPKENGMAGAVAKSEELFNQNSGSFKALQFENPSNSKAHYVSTAPEIYQALNGKVDAIVAGIGTGGTISGIAKYLKDNGAGTHVVGVEPFTSPLLSKGYAGAHKIQGIGANFIPKVLERDLLDEIIDVQNEDAFTFARDIAKKEGFLVGISSGAALKAAVEIASREEFKDKNVVTIFPDSGIKYLSTELFK